VSPLERPTIIENGSKAYRTRRDKARGELKDTRKGGERRVEKGRAGSQYVKCGNSLLERGIVQIEEGKKGGKILLGNKKREWKI